ncbi:MAG: hypothetical protein WCD89_24985 [Anaerocolumna sp.]
MAISQTGLRYAMGVKYEYFTKKKESVYFYLSAGTGCFIAYVCGISVSGPDSDELYRLGRSVIKAELY